MFKKSSSVCYICKKNKFKKELITNDIYGDNTKKKSFYRCTNCEIIFQKPYFTKKQELKFYQKEFEKFMSKRAGSEAGWQNALNHIKSNKKTYKRRLEFLKKNKIMVNYQYSKPHEKYMNITTTNVKNLRYFFNTLDKIL